MPAASQEQCFTEGFLTNRLSGPCEADRKVFFCLGGTLFRCTAGPFGWSGGWAWVIGLSSSGNYPNLEIWIVGLLRCPESVSWQCLGRFVLARHSHQPGGGATMLSLRSLAERWTSEGQRLQIRSPAWPRGPGTMLEEPVESVGKGHFPVSGYPL